MSIRSFANSSGDKSGFVSVGELGNRTPKRFATNRNCLSSMPITKRLGDRRMCLAIPMRIVSVNGHTACCEAKGVRREVSLTLLDGQEPAVGDHVLVHVGYALQTISAADARATWDLFDEIAVALDHADA